MSHEKLLLVKGLLIGTALVGYKVALHKAFRDAMRKEKDNKNKEER